MPSCGPHLLIVGMMAVGKTTLAAQVGRRLGWPWVDLDEELERVVGERADRLLEERGEAAFRALEAWVLGEVLDRPGPLLVAAGGGAVTRAAGRRAAARARWVLWLRAPADLIVARLEAAVGQVRPLVSGLDRDSLRRQVAALTRARAPAYRQVANWQLDVEAGATPPARDPFGLGGDLARQVAEGLRRRLPAACRRLQLPPVAGVPGGWARVVEGGSPASWCRGLAAARASARVGVISDLRLRRRIGAEVARALSRRGHQVVHLSVPSGEEAKTWAVASKLVAALVAGGLGRSDHLVAVGGGAVGDLTGFVASIFMRGIGWSHLPTTTLAAIDAAVGGKTALNLPAGKNLIGTFWPAREVVVAGPALSTLPPAAWAGGWVEALKTALVMDAPTFLALEAACPRLRRPGGRGWAELMVTAMALKTCLVTADPKEAGPRALLNLGHTFGHAIEVATNFAIGHGQAVALGMLAEVAFAARYGLGPPDLEVRLARALVALGLDIGWRRAVIDLDALARDKKRRGPNILLPVVREVGHGSLATVPTRALTTFAARCMAGHTS